MPLALPEVYSAVEIALAAGVHARDVERCAQAQNLQPFAGGFYSTPQAVRMVRHLVSATPIEASRGALFEAEGGPQRRRALPIAVTTVLHMGLIAGLALVSTAARRSGPREAPMSTELVFLSSPGAGGGGGRHVKQPTAPARRSVSRLGSPIPQAPLAESTPAHAARSSHRDEGNASPVASVAADARDIPGSLPSASEQAESRGPGTDAGPGSGTASGFGADDGSGTGVGSGGGTGGGPYQPGAGITPPSLLLEVKPDYTEEGRRRGLEGNVELEIVVRGDGTVGDVALRRGFGAGLDERAIDAVRRWRFAPAIRHGAPVDVVVQVAVGFRLR
jgi:protein TonB